MKLADTYGRVTDLRRFPVLGSLALAGALGLLSGCDTSPENDVPEIETTIAEPEPVATCANPPENGAVLTRDESRGTGAHTVKIVNSGTANTIVNVRDGATGEMVVSFFVAQNQEGSVSDLPDGSYKVQYANGFDLGEDCAQFTSIFGASEDPEILDFPAGSAMVLTYELIPTEGGNFTGESIDPSEFAAE